MKSDKAKEFDKKMDKKQLELGERVFNGARAVVVSARTALMFIWYGGPTAHAFDYLSGEELYVRSLMDLRHIEHGDVMDYLRGWEQDMFKMTRGQRDKV